MSVVKLQRRTWGLIAVLLPLLLLFIFVALRSGPLAPIAVTVSTVESQPITPALAGIGTVQARFIHKIGPTVAGRVKHVTVHVGDSVEAGQVIGEMDAIDLDDRIMAQQAAVKSAEAGLRQAMAKEAFAQTQATRYDQLLLGRGVSEEMAATKRQELAVASAMRGAAQADVARLRSELEALHAQRGNMTLIATVAGLVVARHADPGTTVVAGQGVIDIIDTESLWVDARFDQISAEGLAAGLPATVALRSRRSENIPASVLRIEPLADAITEETLAKIVFDTPPKPLPPLGELAEVTVQLAELPAAPTIPNAAIRSIKGQRGVWKLQEGGLVFTPIVLGRSNLDGQVQVKEGLLAGEQVVVYSEKTLTEGSRVHVVEHLPGALQ
jgi:HlyD family secretion protein